MFPGGDPVLKQFMVDIILKDGTGKIIGKKQIHFGRSFEELLKEGIPRPLINGGITRHIPFRLPVPKDVSPQFLEASVRYALIPQPGEMIKKRYLATLPDEQARRRAKDLIQDYSSFRLLTFRTTKLNSTT